MKKEKEKKKSLIHLRNLNLKKVSSKQNSIISSSLLSLFIKLVLFILSIRWTVELNT